MKQTHSIEKATRMVIIAVFVITTILSLVSCGNQYSPMDSYVNAVIKGHEDSIRHDNEVRVFLDSLNRK